MMYRRYHVFPVALLAFLSFAAVSARSIEKSETICNYYTESQSAAHRRPTRATPTAQQGSEYALLSGAARNTAQDDEETVTVSETEDVFPAEDGEGRWSTRCLPSKNACYAVWRVEAIQGTNTTRNVVIQAGCWMHTTNAEGTSHCGKDKCENIAAASRNRTHFCCCTDNLCNVNFTDVYVPKPLALEVPVESPQKPSTLWIWIIVLGAVLVVFVCLFVLLIWKYRKLQKRKPRGSVEELRQLNLCEAFPNQLTAENPEFNLEDTKIIEKIAMGRYGEVFLASNDGRKMAVKQFTPDHRDYFLNECRIYNYPHMQHDSLLRFLAATERHLEQTDDTFYWLIVDYHPNKSLIDYLKTHTVDAGIFAVMAHTLASGLAWLHSEITRDGVTKPGMVHRDFNSRNVLVKSDLGLCICDMGFALPLRTSDSSSSSGSGRKDENPILNDVGTIRYMAPEVLEGSLNLRDSATALRQVDMYAFGLVLWELATRCSELYQGMPVPEYQLPFQKEAGLHPTFAQMANLVAKKKARPLCPEVWKDGNMVVRFLRDTFEECWDADAEARLTANCVEERLAVFGELWEKQKGGGGNTVFPERKTAHPVPRPVAEEPAENVALLGDVNESFVAPTKNVNEVMSAVNSYNPVLASRIQPHQGRNPCQERNIKPESSEEFTTSGNNLIDRRTGLKMHPTPPDLNMAIAGLSIAQQPVPAPSASIPIASNGRQKKVSNDVAAQRNRTDLSNWFTWNTSKKKQVFTTLMSHRVPPVGSGSSGSPSTSATPSPALANSENKCNLRAATLLPHFVRRDVPVDASNSTQVTCLSPSPSTSGGSPPLRAVSHDRPDPARFSRINDGIEDSQEDDEGLGGSPRQALIHSVVAAQPVMPEISE